MSTPTVVHKRGPSADPAVRTPGAAANALNESLKAAEQHLFSLNLGVEASVGILSEALEESIREGNHVHLGSIQDSALCWGKLDGRWCLYLAHAVDGEEVASTPLLSGSIELRRRAALALPELMTALRQGAQRSIDEIHRATETALAFARGEFDDV